MKFQNRRLIATGFGGWDAAAAAAAAAAAGCRDTPTAAACWGCGDQSTRATRSLRPETRVKL